MSKGLPLIRVDFEASIPLAVQVSQQLAWLIASRDLEPGDRLPTVRDLAAQVGINLHTVRAAYRQLAAEGLVSTRQGRRATVLAYDRTKAVMATPDLPSFTIGVIIPNLAPFYAPLLEGIELAAARQPAMVFICNAHEDPTLFLAHTDRLISKRVDGIIMASPEFPPNAALPPSGHGPPIVFIDHPGASRPGVDFDLEDSSYQATSHMIEHGHRLIGYVTPPSVWPNVAPKLAGFQRAMAEAGREVRSELVAGVEDFAIESGYRAAIRLLDHSEPPTGIVVASDALALGAMHAITSRGLRIPEDVALIGNDGIDIGAIVRPSLTTVALPVREAGVEAVAMLQRLIAGERPHPARVVLGVDLVVRETCGCAHPSR